MDKSKRSDPRGAKKKNDPRRLPTIALTIKEKLFCVEYCKDFNSKRAAVAAGYSEKTAGAIGCHMLKKDKIKRHIDKVKNNLLEAAGVSALSVLLELKKVAYTNITDFKDGWMTEVDFEKLSEDVKAALSEINYVERHTEYGTERIVKFKVHDKIKAITEINKMLGFNSAEKLDLMVNDNRKTVSELFPTEEEIEKKNK